MTSTNILRFTFNTVSRAFL